MKYLSVSSGICAASVAWIPLGWTPIAFSEIAPFPSAVLAYQHPNVPNLGDMTKFEEWNFEPGSIDVLVGGTPCQSFSVAGLRGGLEDGRGNLALTYCKILQKFRPRWFVWENVPGVLSSNGGRDFGAIIGAMAELGYGFAYRVLDAQYFGVPQRRRRVFVVGHFGDWRRAAEVLFEPGCLRGDNQKGRKSKSKVAALTATGVGTCGADDNQAQAGHLIAAAITSRPYADNAAEESKLVAYVRNGALSSVCQTLQSHHSGSSLNTIPVLVTSTGDKSHCLNAGGMGRQDYETETMVVAIQERAVSANPDNGPGGCGFRTDGKAYTLEARSTVQAVAFQSSQSGVRLSDTHATLDANMGSRRHNGVLAFSGRDRGDDGRGYGREPNITGSITETVDATKPPRVAGPSIGVRRLTPRECERLQGFPDDYTNVIYRGKPAADGPRYKACGNSMAVPCMRWIGERIGIADENGGSYQ